MSNSATKEDLDRLERNLKEHIDLRLQALPIEEHSEQIKAIWPKLRELDGFKNRAIGMWIIATLAWGALLAWLRGGHH